MSLIGARQGCGSLCIPSRADAPPGFKVAIAEVVLVQHKPFRSQLLYRLLPEGQNTMESCLLCAASPLKRWKRGYLLYFTGTKVLQRLLWPRLQSVPGRFLQTLLRKRTGKQSIQQHPALPWQQGQAMSQKPLKHFCTTGGLGSTRAAPAIMSSEFQVQLYGGGKVNRSPLRCPNCQFLWFQHTGKAGAGWPTLILLLCTAQDNDPAHYFHFKIAKEGRTHSSKVHAQGKLLLWSTFFIKAEVLPGSHSHNMDRHTVSSLGEG